MVPGLTPTPVLPGAPSTLPGVLRGPTGALSPLTVVPQFPAREGALTVALPTPGQVAGALAATSGFTAQVAAGSIPALLPTATRIAPPPTSSGSSRTNRAGSINTIVNRVPDWIWAALAGLGALCLALGTMATGLATRSARRGRAVSQLQAVAATDALTGLLNRGALESGLEAELGRAKRYGRPLSIAYFDIAGLKTINDVHGHATGDQVLQSVSKLFQETSRDHDLCGRIGGDECVVVLAEQGPEGASAFLDRIREALPGEQQRLGLYTPWGLTAGIATYPGDGESAAELLGAADRRLYRKRGIEIDPRPHS